MKSQHPETELEILARMNKEPSLEVRKAGFFQYLLSMTTEVGCPELYKAQERENTNTVTTFCCIMFSDGIRSSSI